MDHVHVRKKKRKEKTYPHAGNHPKDRHHPLKTEITPVPDIAMTARLLAVEVLLADPESLGNDALESDPYILRDRLRAAR